MLIMLKPMLLLIEIKDDFKIYWKDFPIAKLTTGKDYLNPDLLLIVADKQKLLLMNYFLLDFLNQSDFLVCN